MLKSAIRLKNSFSINSALDTAVRDAFKPVVESTEKNNSQKLSDSEVIVIKALYHIAHWNYEQINEKFEFVTYRTIYKIINRKQRKTVTLTYLTKIPDLFYELDGDFYRGLKVQGVK